MKLLFLAVAAVALQRTSAHDHGNTLVVGGEYGWMTGVGLEQMSALEGDLLVFNYGRIHDVYLMQEPNCDFSPENAKLLGSPSESPYVHVLDEPGTFHFGCSTSGHCASGQQVTVVVSPDIHKGGEDKEDDSLEFCASPVCDWASLKLSERPGEFQDTLGLEYQELCTGQDVFSTECHRFLANVAACGDAKTPGSQQKFSPYLGQISRTFMTQTDRNRASLAGTPIEEENNEEGCPYLEVAHHSVSNMDAVCTDFCGPQVVPKKYKLGDCKSLGYDVAVQGNEGQGVKTLPGGVSVRTQSFSKATSIYKSTFSCDVAGEVPVMIEGVSGYGGETAEECSQICLAAFVMAFVPGAAQGLCTEAGFTKKLREQSVQPAGSPAPMMSSVYGAEAQAAPAAPSCKAGEVLASVAGPAAAYGAITADDCAQFCMVAMALNFIPGAAKGTCSDLGFQTEGKTEAMTPSGSPAPLEVTLFSGKSTAAKEVVKNPKVGWCEEEAMGNTGRNGEEQFKITCIGPAIPLFPGEVVDSVWSLPNPFPRDRQIALLQRGAWMVDSKLEEQSLSELYVHHMGSSIVGGVGSEFRGWVQPFPAPFYEFIDGATIPSFANLHLINTKGVSEADMLPCVECYCVREWYDALEKTSLGDKGGVDCCYDCRTSLPKIPEDFHLKYAFVYEEMRPEMQQMTSMWMDIIPGKIEYDVPIANPGDEPVHVVEHDTFIDYSFPQSKELRILRCSAHMHIGAIGMWMYDGETGEQLCEVLGVHGTGGPNELMNEGGFLVGIEQQYYDDAPLMRPPGHPIKIVAKYDSTIQHTGVMALMWLDMVGGGDQSGFFSSGVFHKLPTCAVEEPLSAPRGLHAFEQTETSVSLMWAAPESGFECSSDVAYMVEMLEAGGKVTGKTSKRRNSKNSPTWQLLPGVVRDTMVQVPVSPATKYTFRVTAVESDSMSFQAAAQEDTATSATVVVPASTTGKRKGGFKGKKKNRGSN